MMDTKNQLESLGHLITIPENTNKYADHTIKVENKWEKIESDVIKKYFEKIKNADAILVINKDKNNIKNYIGGNGLIEIAFAHVLNKKIFLLNPLPKLNYTDEIEAMEPIILKGNLKLIN